MLPLILLLAAAPDAGVPRSTSADGGVAVTTRAPSTETEKLKAEVLELRNKVSALESRIEKLEKLEARLDKLQERFEADLEKRETAEREVAQRKANLMQGTNSVNAALDQLQQGNNSRAVDGWLKNAEQNYTGNAQRFVALARQALANNDLATARQYLGLAVLESTAP